MQQTQEDYGNTGEKVLGKIHSKNEFVVIDDLYISFNNYNKPVSLLNKGE